MIPGNRAILLRSTQTILLACIVIGAGNGMAAQGQARYQVLPVPDVFLKAEGKFEKGMPKAEREALQAAITLKRTYEMKVNNILRGSPPNALENDPETRKDFDGWYAQYYFAILTHPEHLADWPATRQKFLRMMAATMPEDVHTHLVDLTRQTMMTIVQGNFHPVARYNAMLLIGQLNTNEYSLIGNKTPPVPYIQGLVDALAEFENPNQIDAVRVAALVGILRHVRIDRQLPDASRRLVGRPGEARIISLMLSLVNAKVAPDGRSQGGHDWMRRRAIEILGILGSVGANGQVVPALQAVLADDENPISIRCCAAEALGRLNYPANTSVDVAEIAKNMGAVAASACRDEIRRVETELEREELEKNSLGGGGGSYMSGGGSYMGGGSEAMGGESEAMGGPDGISMGMYDSETSGAFGTPSLDGAGGFDPLAYRVALTRRRIKYRTVAVKTGLMGEPKETVKKFVPFSAKPEAGTEEAKPPVEEKSGILALARSADDLDYVQKVIKGVNDIIAQVDNPSLKDLSALVADVRERVKSLEDDCGIVVNVDEVEAEAKEAEGLLTNPLDNLGSGLGEMPAVEPVAKPPAAPAGKTPPKGAPKPTGKTVVPPAKKGAVAPTKKAAVPPPAKQPAVPSPKKAAPAAQP